MFKLDAVGKWIIYLTVFFVCSAASAFGQAQTAGMQGDVTDISGAAVPGAAVTITDVDTSSVRSLTTDGDGRYAASSLMIGNYKVQVTMQGFAPQTQTGLVLAVGQVLSVDFKLQVGTVSQEVMVNASSAPQINTTTSETGTLIESNQLQELPLNGRNAQQLEALVPGVQPTQAAPSGGANFGAAQRYSVAGARIDSGGVLLDGVEIRGFWGEQAGLNSIGSSLGVESIAEFSTLTSSFSAQYNNASVLNEVTRSGTNEFHGSAYGFFRNSAMDARSFFQPLSGPPAFHRDQFGGALGGPIQKGKTFFFVNYEGIRAEQAASSIVLVPDANAHSGIVPCNPTAAGCTVSVGVNSVIAPYLALWPNYGQPGGPALPAGYVDSPFTTGTGQFTATSETPESENYFAMKVDRALSAKNNLSFRWVHDEGSVIDPYFAGDNYSIPSIETDPESNWYATLQDRHIFSANLINVATFSLVRTNQQEVINLARVPDILKVFSTQGSPGSIAITNVTGIPAPGYEPLQQIQNIYTEQDEVDWVHGAHSFKFGGSVARIQCQCVQASNSGGAWTFPSLTSFLQNKPSMYQGEFTASPSLTPAQASIRYARQTNIGVFAQDDWRVTRRLTVNLGIRDDYITNPIEVRGFFYDIDHLDPLTCSNNPACDGGTPEPGVATTNNLFTHNSNMFRSNPSTRNIQPRVGLAWDIFGDGKTSFRAAYGIFDELIYPRFYTPGSGFVFPNGTTQLVSFSAGNTFPTVSPAAIIPQSRTKPAYDQCCTPYLEEFSATLERQLPWKLKVSLGYIGSKGVHLYEQQDYNTNLPTPGTQFRPFSPATAATLPICKTTNPAFNAAGCAAASAGYNAGNDGAGLVPNVALTSVEWMLPKGNSNFNAGVVTVSRNFHTIQFFSGFTYSRCLDYGSIGTPGPDVGNDSTSYVFPSEPKKYEYGPCAFNITKNWTSNAIIPLPFHGNRLKEGWMFAVISSARTGNPVTPSLPAAIDEANLGNFVFDTERPNRNPNFAGSLYMKGENSNGTEQWLNPAAFQIGPPGVFGNASRGIINGPNYVDVDLSFMKRTSLPKFREAASLEIRADFFNALNHTNFGLPNASFFAGSLANPTASSTGGQISSTVGTARQLQFSARFVF